MVTNSFIPNPNYMHVTMETLWAWVVITAHIKDPNIYPSRGEVISVCNQTLYTCSADGIFHVHGTWTICDSWKQAARQAFTVHKTILYHRPSAWLLTSWMSSQYHHRVGTMALAVFAVPPVRRNPARCSVMFRGAWMAEGRAFLQFTQAWKQR